MKIKFQLLVFLISLLMIGIGQSVKVKAEEEPPADAAGGDAPAEGGDDKEKDKKDQPKFVQKGWLKYIQQKAGGPALPNKFLVNTNFGYQMQLNKKTDIVSTDDAGFLNIPDDFHFFFMMDINTLYMVNGRTNDLAKTTLSIDFHMLLDRQIDEETKEETGGVLDIGDFREGFCFKLVSKDMISTWTLCADSLDQKTLWLKFIREYVKLKVMASADGPVSAVGDTAPPMDLPLGFSYGASEGKDKAIEKIVDGSWVVLQGWTECTLACGGGKSYEHRMCVPPQGGGMPCIGQPVLAKTCNEQPCPPQSEDGEEKKQKLLDPIVRVVPISSRFQRFELCIIKEGDLILQMEMVKGLEAMELPVRVILNNRTISIFSTSKYNNIYKSFDLPLLTVEMDGRKDYKKRCFTLQDNRDPAKKETLCTMPQALRKGESQEGAKNQWMKDIMIFKDQCQTKVSYTDEGNSAFVNELKTELSDDMSGMAADNMKVDKVEEKDTTIEKTSETAVSAIDTEVKFERLKREELQDLTELMLVQIKSALDTENKQEKACTKKEAKAENKALIGKMEKEKKEVQEEFKKTEKETILTTRNKATFQMEKDKIIAARKLKAQKERLFLLKEKIGKEVVDENRVGDKKKCDPSQGDSKQKAFCEKAFGKRPYVYVNCIKNSLQFCLGCCEHEFGSLVIDSREECYKVCFDFGLPKEGDKKAPAKGADGWIQLNNGNKIPAKKARFMKKVLKKEREDDDEAAKNTTEDAKESNEAE